MTPSPRPADLLAELGIGEPDDIDVEVIAHYCGATVLYESLDGCEAQIVGRGDRAIITVKKGSRRPRQRFSVAHELGHWMRDRGKAAGFACNEKTFLSEWSRENPEKRANRYAADLLLPELLFEPDARGQEMTFATVGKLAERYQTSLTATAIRLVELGSFPAMLICTEAGRRKWFVRGTDVPSSVWPIKDLRSESVAWDLFRGSSPPQAPIDVAADSWVDHPDAGRYVIREDSRKTGDLVLSLLWWQDQRQLVDLMASG